MSAELLFKKHRGDSPAWSVNDPAENTAGLIDSGELSIAKIVAGDFMSCFKKD